jgi:integrase
MGRDGSGVREVSKTSYEISFTYKGIACRERIKLKPSTANRKRVENHLGAIKDAIDRGIFNYSDTFPTSPRRLLFIESKGEALTLRSYLDSWHESQKKHLKESTWDDYRKTIKRINYALGKIILSELKRSHVKDFLKDMDVSNKTLSNIQSPLRKALQDAVDDEVIETNPLYDWTYSRQEAPKTTDDVDPFTAKEQALILTEMTGQGKNFFQFAFWTGMRTSELVALDWEDIDWQRRVAYVRKAKTQGSKSIERTKTESSTREVKLLEPAYRALIAQKEHTLLAGKEVFQNPRTLERWAGDKPIRQCLWIPAVKKAGVRYRRPYQTRHTYASMMLSAGESPMWVAEQMGHKDWAMIRHVYGKFMPEATPNAGDKAVTIFAEKSCD